MRKIVETVDIWIIEGRIWKRSMSIRRQEYQYKRTQDRWWYNESISYVSWEIWSGQQDTELTKVVHYRQTRSRAISHKLFPRYTQNLKKWRERSKRELFTFLSDTDVKEADCRSSNNRQDWCITSSEELYVYQFEIDLARNPSLP